MEDQPITAPGRPTRQGWKEAFQASGSSADDTLLLDTLQNAIDPDEWTW